MIPSRSLSTLRQPFIRCISSSSVQKSMVDLSVDTEGIALITMKKLPVNSFSPEFLQEINVAIDAAQNNHCKGLIITSAARVFSAGIDLNLLNKPDVDQLRVFWSAIQDLFLRLYGSGEITSAVAINGHAAGSGCLISMFCDYRVMVGSTKGKIGLNDTAVGIKLRPWLCDIMAQIMGHRQAEMALTASKMFSAEEALKVNLVDEIANDNDDAIEKCKEFIRKYEHIPIKTKANTKRIFKENTVKLVELDREKDMKLFTDSIVDPFVQEQIAKYVQQLNSKK